MKPTILHPKQEHIDACYDAARTYQVSKQAGSTFMLKKLFESLADAVTTAFELTLRNIALGVNDNGYGMVIEWFDPDAKKHRLIVIGHRNLRAQWLDPYIFDPLLYVQLEKSQKDLAYIDHAQHIIKTYWPLFFDYMHISIDPSPIKNSMPPSSWYRNATRPFEKIINRSLYAGVSKDKCEFELDKRLSFKHRATKNTELLHPFYRFVTENWIIFEEV